MSTTLQGRMEPRQQLRELSEDELKLAAGGAEHSVGVNVNGGINGGKGSFSAGLTYTIKF